MFGSAPGGPGGSAAAPAARSRGLGEDVVTVWLPRPGRAAQEPGQLPSLALAVSSAQTGVAGTSALARFSGAGSGLCTCAKDRAGFCPLPPGKSIPLGRPWAGWRRAATADQPPGATCLSPGPGWLGAPRGRDPPDLISLDFLASGA